MSRGPKPDYLQLVGAAATGLDAADRRPTGPQCGGRTTRGGICALAPGWGTDHGGVGSCKHHEGQLEGGSPCPLPLTALERRLWDDLSDHLEGLGLLNMAFWPSLFGLVVALAKLHEARLAATAGEMVKGKGKDQIRKHPATTVANQMLAQVRTYCVELGLTPSALAKMGTKEPEKKSKMDNLIDGGAG